MRNIQLLSEALASTTEREQAATAKLKYAQADNATLGAQVENLFLQVANLSAQVALSKEMLATAESSRNTMKASGKLLQSGKPQSPTHTIGMFNNTSKTSSQHVAENPAPTTKESNSTDPGTPIAAAPAA